MWKTKSNQTKLLLVSLLPLNFDKTKKNSSSISFQKWAYQSTKKKMHRITALTMARSNIGRSAIKRTFRVVHFWNLIATCTFLVLAIQSHSIGIRTTMELRTLSLNTLINQRASSTLGVALPVDIFLDLKFIWITNILWIDFNKVLSEEMYFEGYKNITNIDFSNNLIKELV